MEQTESCIPPTPSRRVTRLAYGLAALARLRPARSIFCFASLATPGAGLKGQIHIRFVFMMFFKTRRLFAPPDRT